MAQSRLFKTFCAERHAERTFKQIAYEKSDISEAVHPGKKTAYRNGADIIDIGVIELCRERQ